MDRNKKISGFTLIELIVAVALTSTLSVAIFQYLNQSNAIFSKNKIRTELEQKALNLGEEIRNDLTKCTMGTGGGWTLTTDTSFSGNLVTGYDFTSETMEFTPLVNVTWRIEASADDPLNGADDDNDGTIDEMQLVRVANGVTTIKTADIPPGGTFELSRNLQVITFKITLTRYNYETQSNVTFITSDLKVTLQ